MLEFLLMMLGPIVGYAFLIKIVKLQQSNKSERDIQIGIRNCVIGMFISFGFSAVLSIQVFSIK